MREAVFADDLRPEVQRRAGFVPLAIANQRPRFPESFSFPDHPIHLA
jgi:hypothetical protein